jgi:DNA polymerase elongation subunit (family B)
MNRLIDSRVCYELLQRDFVIPHRNNYHRYEHIRSIEDIIDRDKGGMIFSPQIGLHENVVVLDYENEYPNLIMKHNLSYETVNLSKEGKVVQDPSKESALLPTIIESVLKKRNFFKDLREEFVTNTPEWLWCQQRIDTLKSILVCLYGTTGSFWNRFANVLAFEEINKISREVLIKTKEIVQQLGFELVYADTDSVFLKKKGASMVEYENVREALTKRNRASNFHRTPLQIPCVTSLRSR